MTKLEIIKQKLSKILFQFATIKTDKAVLEYDGEELTINTKVYVLDENGERTMPEDGNYITEEDITLVVVGGVITEIIEKEEEPTVEEPTVEEVVEAVEEEPTVEVVEEPTVDVGEQIEELKAQIEELKVQINEFADIVKRLVEKNIEDNTTIDERLSKIEQMSVAKPIEKEIENIKTTKKTGDAKVDKFLEKYC